MSSDPNYCYDISDMEETDYKAEFNLMWRQWTECKDERNEASTRLEMLREATRELKDITGYWKKCDCNQCRAWRRVDKFLD